MLYARNPAIRMETNRAVQTQGEIPYLTPALVLLYQSTALENPDYRLDFPNTIPHLRSEELMWLKAALDTEYQDAHEWSAEIQGLLERVRTGNLQKRAGGTSGSF